jgi:hypothetical protein
MDLRFLDRRRQRAATCDRSTLVQIAEVVLLGIVVTRAVVSPV